MSQWVVGLTSFGYQRMHQEIDMEEAEEALEVLADSRTEERTTERSFYIKVCFYHCWQAIKQCVLRLCENAQ